MLENTTLSLRRCREKTIALGRKTAGERIAVFLIGMAERIGVEWRGPDTLFDPIANVRLGTAYLRELADRYDGDVNVALAAYNWGPGRIDRRLARGSSVPRMYVEQVRRAVDRFASIGSSRS